MVEAEALASPRRSKVRSPSRSSALTKWPCRGPLHVGVASAVATAVTHPQLWAAAFWAYPRFPYWPAILVLEALVIAAEGVLIAWMANSLCPAP